MTDRLPTSLPPGTNDARFWERKTLAEMDAQEWESLCDGCARCCAIKLEDETTGEVVTTRVVCRLLDLESCRCTRYPERHRLVPDCVRLTAETVASFAWLPSSCAYRRLAEGRGLAWWHPLVSGDPDTVVDAGISVRGSVVSEREIHPQDIVEHVAVRMVDGPQDSSGAAPHPGGPQAVRSAKFRRPETSPNCTDEPRSRKLG